MNLPDDTQESEVTYFDSNNVVIIEVLGGVASVLCGQRNIEVIIVDYDNNPDLELDLENGTIIWGEAN